MVPLQVPGGPELLIVGLILFILVSCLVIVVGGAAFLFLRSSRKSAPEKRRVDDLERRVEELEAKHGNAPKSDDSERSTE